MAGVFAPAAHAVEIWVKPFELARPGVDADVVDVALRAVEEDAARARLGALERPARHRGPVAGNQLSAHDVGMRREIHHRDVTFPRRPIRSTLTVSSRLPRGSAMPGLPTPGFVRMEPSFIL